MNPAFLLWPMILHACVTLFLYMPMSRARVRTVTQGGVKASVYRMLTQEPEESLRFSNAIRNQNETGVLFYAVCLALYAAGGASIMAAVLAWAFALVKIAHVVIHVTTNRLRYRRPVFFAAFVILVALWILLALHLAGLL